MDNRVVWRVTGRRANGAAVVRDELTKARALKRAEHMAQAQRSTDEPGVWLPPLEDITITPSKPVVFDYGKGKRYVQ